MCARIVCPFSSSTAKVVLGNTCLIVPKSSSGASFEGSAETFRGAALKDPRRAMIAPSYKTSYGLSIPLIVIVVDIQDDRGVEHVGDIPEKRDGIAKLVVSRFVDREPRDGCRLGITRGD